VGNGTAGGRDRKLDGTGGAVNGGVPVSVTVGTGPSCPARELIMMTAMISAPAMTTTAMAAVMIAPVSPMANGPAVLAVLFASGGGDGTAGALHVRPSQ
jgi:hypothetical protein